MGDQTKQYWPNGLILRDYHFVDGVVVTAWKVLHDCRVECVLGVNRNGVIYGDAMRPDLIPLFKLGSGQLTDGRSVWGVGMFNRLTTPVRTHHDKQTVEEAIRRFSEAL